MVTGEVPASTILIYGKSMAGCDMPLEHLAAPATVQANDIIAVNRSPDRDGGSSLFVGFCHWFTEADKRLMHGRDQRTEFIGRDLILSNIGGSYLCNEIAICRCGRRFLGHIGSSCRDRQNTMPGNSGRRLRISIGITSLRLPPIGSPSRRPHPTFLNRYHRLKVESEDL
jgi:hypothetical protein